MDIISDPSNHINQHGLGLVEVLLALLLLSISVLGYAALQVRAMHAAQEASHYIDAVNLAKDMAERIRVNPQGFMQKVNFSTINSTVTCTLAIPCSSGAMAEFDFVQVSHKAQERAMQIAILPCQSSTKKRQCIYVAWRHKKVDQAEPPMTECIHARNDYPDAHCLVVEAYPYVG
ncbi:type IV pilus modification protein PilV [Acinetobacter rudis]|uniref:Type IV pilus modification protein PilV n=1 Tax=Acinetobacter rudis CIP 110305 TaxID=421052 RepID=S3NUI1_9GAMM|nr:type IV pilus modification protein PilV [Acinetobacter rudis]EPF70331.1 type IV pilus modification protein PilV [Acinetobacter rudis CIP 110305]